MSSTQFIFLSLLIVSCTAADTFSPLSTFFDIDVSTSASFYSGKSFGPGCALGGMIPDGFIPVAMNGKTMGLDNTAAACGMCIAIHAPAPLTSNPAENQGVTGEYFAFVYEVCNDCTQQQGMQLGIPGQGSSQIVWRSIPCPVKQQVSVFFDSTTPSRARFQVRGLLSPVITLTINGQARTMDGAFWIYDQAVYPFTIVAKTALNEQVTIIVPAFREYGDMSDLIIVKKDSGSRNTSVNAPAAVSKMGTGEITTKSALQTRTITTMSQMGRQMLTITNTPNEMHSNSEPTMMDLNGADRNKVDSLLNGGLLGVASPMTIDQAAPIMLNGLGQIAQPNNATNAVRASS
jgi:hypothetical protein